MTVTDITGGSILLVGASGGLGGALLAELGRRRPRHLILLGRSASSLAAAAQDARAGGAENVSVVLADLADLRSVAAAGREIVGLVDAGRPPLSSVLLNAGVQLLDRRQVSAEGFERTFAINVMAQHVLLRTVLPATAPGAHVVAVGSGTHYGDWHSYGLIPKPAWQDPALLARPDDDATPADGKAGDRAYATSKLGVVLLARAWQARHGDRARFNVYDPGLMPGTGLAREQRGAPLWVWNHAMPVFTFLPGWSTPRRSAKHLAALAVGEAHADLAGGYVEVGRERPASAASFDVVRQDELWDTLEKLTGPYTARLPAREVA